MLELNAGSIQRKLNLEKESHQRLESEFSLLKTEVIVLKQSLSRAEGNLRLEIDRCDATEQEKTKLLNQMETEKVSFDKVLNIYYSFINYVEGWHFYIFFAS